MVFLYVLDGLAQLQVLHARNDALVTCYIEFNKTIDLMFQDYWWPQFWKYVKEFVGSCNVYVRIKNLHHCPHGFLQPLSITTSPWFSISMDFITIFTPSSSYDSILVVVDCLTKMVHFSLCTKIIISKRTTKLVFNHVFLYHGLLKIPFLIMGFSLYPSFGSNSLNLQVWKWNCH